MSASTPTPTRTFPVAEDVIGLDLLFQGRPRSIAAFSILGPGRRFVLIESGPESTLDNLKAALAEAGLELGSLEAVLVTHIHLDHAGAAGALAKEAGCPVYVHHVGLPHLAAPGRLWTSASRVFGPAMETLWKGITPVPEGQLRPLGEYTRLSFFGRVIEAHYTPGHASHHVVYTLDGEILFAGDVAGVRLPGLSYVRVPAMPPELDIEQWQRTVERLRSLRPRRLVLTHFGPVDGPIDAHLDAVQRQLRHWGETVLEGLRRGLDTDEMVRQLEALEAQEMRTQGAGTQALGPFELVTPVRLVLEGYRRYWTRVHPERLSEGR